MNRKELAQEAVRIQRQGWYLYQGERVGFFSVQRAAVEGSELIQPSDWMQMELPQRGKAATQIELTGESAVDEVFRLNREHRPKIGLLNFASAKNPGGGFLNGAMAQEESLAVSSGLYETLCKNPLYYERNRACRSMAYTDHAIFSPDVPFFRDGQLRLTAQPAVASVLTMPAVNLGQAVQRGEDQRTVKGRMRARMGLVLRGFAAKGCRSLILGAYGCGVFRNDPAEIAAWWKEWLDGAYSGVFESVTFAVYDRSKGRGCLRAFEQVFGPSGF